jgi:gliding motility-associated lipoprotein GldH
MKSNNNRRPALYLLPAMACLCAAIACTTPAAFEEIVTLEDDQWGAGRAVHITLPVTDSLGAYAIVFYLRNNNDYPFRNIYLLVDVWSPTGVSMRDTLEYELVDTHGNWLGKRGSYWIDHRLLYRPSVMFTSTGNYAFRIRHGMRANPLPGVGAVGLRLESADLDE